MADNLIAEFYIFVRECPTTPWLQNSSWATVEDASTEAEKLEETLTVNLSEDERKDLQIFICQSINGSFPVPFFNWMEQE